MMFDVQISEQADNIAGAAGDITKKAATVKALEEGLKEGIFDSPEDRDYYCDVIIDEAEKIEEDED